MFLSGLNLWELDGEVGFHTRIDHLDPYFVLRGGYAFDGSLGSGAAAAVNGSAPSLSVHGWNAGMAVGGDYYFNHYLSLGLEAGIDFLFLQRPPVAQLPPQFTDPTLISMLSPADQQRVQDLKKAYQESGSSVGFGANGTVHLGVHF
jgi:hypothetical protein